MFYKSKIHLPVLIFLSLAILAVSAFYYLYSLDYSSISGKKIQKTQDLVDLYNKKNADLIVEKSQYETIYYIQERAEKLNMKNVTTSFALNMVDTKIPTLR
ncbi:hypothetical protein KA001_00335 [Patescibacteria group bacterium]|nr:hypothetical protein [Patescibacteria group bacterium]